MYSLLGHSFLIKQNKKERDTFEFNSIEAEKEAQNFTLSHRCKGSSLTDSLVPFIPYELKIN